MARLPVWMDEDLKDHLQNLARREGTSTSEVVHSLVRRNVRDRDRGAALPALWTQTTNGPRRRPAQMCA